MADLSIDVTNACNRDCIHCLRDKLEPRKHLSIDLFRQILDQAYDCGVRHICLTGGEPSVHPAWSEVLFTLAKRGLEFSIVSNGNDFKQKTLPILLEPTVKRHLSSICFSLDGASADSHNTLRGEHSFQEVIEAASLCHLKGIPFSIKTVVTNINKDELTEVALLCSALGANQHSFLVLAPTPRSIEKELIPSLKEMRTIYSFITGSLVSAMKAEISLEGSWGIDHALFSCNAYQQSYAVDHLGNLLFCCNLSHVCNGSKPAIMGKEFLIDLKKENLKEGIIRHFVLLAQFTKDRLNDTGSPSKLLPYPCWWCLNYFDKLEWTKSYSHSSWVNEVLSHI